MAVESPNVVNHEEIADHALLLSEAADVLLDMALSPASRAEDLEDIESINHAYDEGATSFVTKPVNWRLLSYQLRYVLRAQKVAAAA